MSSLRDQLSQLQIEMVARQKQNDKLQQEHYQHQEADQLTLNALIRLIVREEKLLNLCTWTLKVYNRKPFLEAKETAGDLKVRPLAELTERDYHSSFYFYHFKDGERGHNISLRFNDGDMRLVFDEPADINSFIKEYGVTVHADSLDEEIDMLQSAIDALNAAKAFIK